MQPHRDFVFAKGADRLIEHDLAPIDVKVLLFQRFSDVAGGNMSQIDDRFRPPCVGTSA